MLVGAETDCAGNSGIEHIKETPWIKDIMQTVCRKIWASRFKNRVGRVQHI